MKENEQTTLNEVENEEEVLARQDEYLDHALFEILQVHSREMEELALDN
jgi:hypothetical protein